MSKLNVDLRLTQLWGKELTRRDLNMLEALGWAEKRIERDAVIWATANKARLFQVKLHIRGRPLRFRTMEGDEWLAQRAEECRLTCLDRFFMKGGRCLRLRLLLELVDDVMNGDAFYLLDGNANLVFLSHLRPPWHLVGFDEDTLSVMTPGGLWCDRPDDEVDDLGIRPIIAELQRRGLMELVEKNGVRRWEPTEAGVDCGMREVYPALKLLIELGLHDQVVECDDHPTWASPPSGDALLDKIFGPRE